MKNSSDPTPSTQQEPPRKEPPFLLQILFSEGGLSLLVILPFVLIYYFMRAI